MGEKIEKIRNIPKIEDRTRDFPGSTPVIGPIEEGRDQIPSLLAELRSITRKPFSPDRSRIRNRERDRERKRIFSTKGDETAVFRLRFEVNTSSSTCPSLSTCARVYIYISKERERALRSLDSWLLSRRRWWKSSRLRWWPNTRVGCFRNTRGSSPSSADLYVRSGQSMTTNTRAVARVSMYGESEFGSCELKYLAWV